MSEISSKNTEEEGGDSSEEKREEKGKEKNIVNENENATNVGEMLVKVSQFTKPNQTKSVVSDHADYSWLELFVGLNGILKDFSHVIKSLNQI